MYKVVKRFYDLHSDHSYSVGDIFPHDGGTVTEDRIEELSSNKNKLGTPLIKKIGVDSSDAPGKGTEVDSSDAPEEGIEETPKRTRKTAEK